MNWRTLAAACLAGCVLWVLIAGLVYLLGQAVGWWY